MIIETKRLILRPVDVHDDIDIYEYSKDESVGRNAGWKPHDNIEETREIMQDVFIDQEGVFGIILKENKKLIGTIGLIDDPKRMNESARMIGYALSKNYWGHGFMTEAAEALLHYGFNLLNAEIISAYCYPGNLRSKSVIKKCGFTFEGCLRLCEILYDGTTYDNECYSITADEYKKTV